MRFLVDTNVISEARRERGPAAIWLASIDTPEVCFSVVTLAELERGVLIVSRRHQDKAAGLRTWLARLRRTYEGRVVPITSEVALVWGRLSAERTRPVLDTFLAATALVHDLVVVTRNVRDFGDTGVRLLNPWSLK